MNGIRALIAAERKRQDKMFGPHAGFDQQTSDKSLVILAEEFGEVARAVYEGDYENLEEELVQVAAVCWAWLETL
jgi:NTP pyrophosphatase (non-canonical NTP hydrolase)